MPDYCHKQLLTQTFHDTEKTDKEYLKYVTKNMQLAGVPDQAPQ